VSTASALQRELSSVVGVSHVLAGGHAPAYEHDWTGRFRGRSRLVVRPADIEQVAQIVSTCRTHGVPIVPQGGNTGLVGGGVPLDGEVVLSLVRLSTVAVDAAEGTVTAGAGVSVRQLHEAATAAGLGYGVDLASRDSATIGGTVATNAGGLRVMRYGDTRAQVLGVQVVTGTGSVASGLRSLRRDNTGYHLPSLMCGSEGTLGVITGVTVRLRRPPKERYVLLVGLGSLEQAVSLARATRFVDGVAAVEFMQSKGVALVAQLTKRRPPLPEAAVLLLVEVADGPEPERMLGLLGQATGDVLLGQNTRDRDRLWQWRERHTEAVAKLGVAVKMDVTLPLSALASFVEQVEESVRQVAPPGRCWLFGHLADGNVHVNVTGAVDRADAVQDAVFTLVATLGGSISTEHGIGRAKRGWLSRVRSDAELMTFRALKSALDPDGVLNPHVLLGPAR
jgi:FAD/FMN-containing dehydrogenase